MHIHLAVNFHTVGLRIDFHRLTETGIFTVTQVAQLETQQVGQAVSGE
jgi:predicted flap endonuclease-1-like 5' DNA nuclease